MTNSLPTPPATNPHVPLVFFLRTPEKFEMVSQHLRLHPEFEHYSELLKVAGMTEIAKSDTAARVKRALSLAAKDLSLSQVLEGAPYTAPASRAFSKPLRPAHCSYFDLPAHEGWASRWRLSYYGFEQDRNALAYAFQCWGYLRRSASRLSDKLVTSGPAFISVVGA